MSQEERRYFCRLWVYEGVPAVFLEAPMLYQAILGWLGKMLGEDPKNFTLLGAGRFGYSLEPRPNLESSYSGDPG